MVGDVLAVGVGDALSIVGECEATDCCPQAMVTSRSRT
jgi:hypothetical protein